MSFFKNYKAIIFIIILLITVTIVLSYNVKQKSSAGFLTKVVMEVASPLQNFLSSSIKAVANSWSRYLFLVRVEEENKTLKKTIDALKAQLILYQEGYYEAQRLRDLLALKDEYKFNLVAARVIGRGQMSLTKTITIDKGSAHGLRSGMPVMAGPGLVGRLVDVSWHAAKILPLIDESSNIDAFVQRTRLQGIIRGAGSRGCVLKYISKIQDVKEEDVIVSSGIGGVFPKGLMIGRILHVDRQEAGLFLRINVAPVIDFSRLEEVMVLTYENDGKESQR